MMRENAWSLNAKPHVRWDTYDLGNLGLDKLLETCYNGITDKQAEIDKESTMHSRKITVTKIKRQVFWLEDAYQGERLTQEIVSRFEENGYRISEKDQALIEQTVRAK